MQSHRRETRVTHLPALRGRVCNLHRFPLGPAVIAIAASTQCTRCSFCSASCSAFAVSVSFVWPTVRDGRSPEAAECKATGKSGEARRKQKTCLTMQANRENTQTAENAIRAILSLFLFVFVFSVYSSRLVLPSCNSHTLAAGLGFHHPSSSVWLVLVW